MISQNNGKQQQIKIVEGIQFEGFVGSSQQLSTPEKKI